MFRNYRDQRYIKDVIRSQNFERTIDGNINLTCFNDYGNEYFYDSVIRYKLPDYELPTFVIPLSTSPIGMWCQWFVNPMHLPRFKNSRYYDASRYILPEFYNITPRNNLFDYMKSRLYVSVNMSEGYARGLINSMREEIAIHKLSI